MPARTFVLNKQDRHEAHPNSKGGTNWISVTRIITASAAIVTILRIFILHTFELATCGPQLASPQVPLWRPSAVGDDVDDGLRERAGRLLR
jgi:hypothetical protein